MRAAQFLPYYLTLFALSARNSWPLDPKIFMQNPLEMAMGSFTNAQMQRFIAFSTGLKAYFEAPKPILPKDLSPPQNGQPLFIIPSLIMPPALLHLTPHHSFLNFLTQNGFASTVLDWEQASPQNCLEDYKKVCQQAYASLSPSPVVVGLGDGALFALSLEAPGLVLMGGPIRAPQEEPLLQLFLHNMGGLHPLLTRLFFSVGQSEKVVQKMIGFPEITQKDLFVAVEDALNQPRLCPVFSAQSFLSGDFSRFYNPEKTTAFFQKIPKLLIQPKEGSLTFLEPLFPSSQILTPPLGNFGLLASPFALLHVWGPLVKWLQEKT